MTPMNESILKTDRRGRLRYTPEQKNTMVEAYLASGLSAPRFAKHHGVNYQTLVSWIKKSKTKAASQAPHPPLFSLIAAEIHHSPDVAASHAMEVLLPGGAKLLISSRGQVDLAAALIGALENSRPC